MILMNVIKKEEQANRLKGCLWMAEEKEKEKEKTEEIIDKVNFEPQLGRHALKSWNEMIAFEKLQQPSVIDCQQIGINASRGQFVDHKDVPGLKAEEFTPVNIVIALY